MNTSRDMVEPFYSGSFDIFEVRSKSLLDSDDIVCSTRRAKKYNIDFIPIDATVLKQVQCSASLKLMWAEWPQVAKETNIIV